MVNLGNILHIVTKIHTLHRFGEVAGSRRINHYLTLLDEIRIGMVSQIRSIDVDIIWNKGSFDKQLFEINYFISQFSKFV